MTFNQKGFSLIEVLISLIILAVGLTGLIKLQVYMDQLADHAERSITALHLAESQLELFSAHRMSGVESTTCVSTAKFEGFDCIVSGSQNIAHYQLTWTVDDLVHGDLKAIHIKVQWNNRWQQPQSLSLNTMISR